MAKVTLILEDGIRPDGTEIVSMEIHSDSSENAKSIEETTTAEHLGAEAFAFITQLMSTSSEKLVEPIKNINNEEMN